jgi:hypothetical protein
MRLLSLFTAAMSKHGIGWETAVTCRRHVTWLPDPSLSTYLMWLRAFVHHVASASLRWHRGTDDIFRMIFFRLYPSVVACVLLRCCKTVLRLKVSLGYVVINIVEASLFCYTVKVNDGLPVADTSCMVKSLRTVRFSYTSDGRYADSQNYYARKWKQYDAVNQKAAPDNFQRNNSFHGLPENVRHYHHHDHCKLRSRILVFQTIYRAENPLIRPPSCQRWSSDSLLHGLFGLASCAFYAARASLALTLCSAINWAPQTGCTVWPEDRHFSVQI